LSSTEILKRVSFQNEKKETESSSLAAIDLLKQSPYAENMKSAGLFLTKLHSQAKTLKRLISPRLGNQVFFAAQLMQAARPRTRTSEHEWCWTLSGTYAIIDLWKRNAHSVARQ
jgi:hypothetical protein